MSGLHSTDSCRYVSREMHWRIKEYKLVFLNKGMKLFHDKDIATAEGIINQMVSEGWTLQQIACPGDWAGALVGVFYREKK